jgi:diadenosine tetraphosphate (Ap4A) HIT family hydrolase
MSGATASCVLCEVSGASPTAVSAHWALGVLPGYDLPGWFVLQSRRHVAALSELDADALSQLGACLASAVDAVAASVPCDKVYLYRFGETHEHWHVLLCAKPADAAREHTAAMLVVHRETYRDDAAAARVCADVSDRLHEWPASQDATMGAG